MRQLLTILLVLSLVQGRATAQGSDPCPKVCEQQVQITYFGGVGQGINAYPTSQTPGKGSNSCVSTCTQCKAVVHVHLDAGPLRLSYLSHDSPCYQGLADPHDPYGGGCNPLQIPKDLGSGETDEDYPPSANCADSQGATMYLEDGSQTPPAVQGGVEITLNCLCQ